MITVSYLARTPAADPQRAAGAPTDRCTREGSGAAAALVALLRASEALRLDEVDDEADVMLRHLDRARTTVGELVDRGTVPPHLAVRVGEPPVVVARTLLVAWQHVARGDHGVHDASDAG